MRPLILASLAFLSGCCLSMEEFDQQAEEAAACSPGDTCVLAGSAQCLCARPVNASKAAELNASAGDVCCGGTMVECIAFTNLRCENGQCVGDIQ
ncbi:hypothetical protein [Hyalangium minutum]|uniref:Lipoprotein n=1 Tax=Hyalangium minutum TaxID=394096 RepID=A0A085WCK1_9BACT|nr:hypothetical protein [Hyalangium minutum]KFE65414.1 hypothetical protein DB31_1530 [Hyalangium minutum]